MDPAKQRAIASRGGRAAHALGRAHRFTHAEAVRAGKIGGRHSNDSRSTLRRAA
jgi:hypothetical protein